MSVGTVIYFFIGIVRIHVNQGFYLILLLKLHLANNYENTTNIIYKFLLTLCIAILAIILIPFGIFTHYLFLIYKLLIIVLVKIYLGSKYDGYPSAFDVSFTIGQKTSRQIINFIIAVEDNDSSSDFFLKLKNQIQERVENKNIHRLLSLSKKYFGYEFYKKDTFDINDYLREFDVSDKDYATREELLKAFDAIINNPLPKNNQATWEALVSKQTVSWLKNVENKRHRIIIFRLYHTVGDAACGNKIIHALFADFDSKIVFPDVKITTPTNKSSVDDKLTWNVFKNHLNHRRDIRRKPANILHNPKLSYHRRSAWVIEENKKYVDMIKNIKNRRQNLTFNTVVIAGVSLSLSKFCQKKGKSAPKSMPLLYAINTKPEDLGAYEATDLASINYENALTWAQIKLPIICDRNRNFSNNDDVLYLLSKIEKEVELFKLSRDLQMQKWFSEDMFDILTIPFIEHMMQWENPAFDVSNLPGCKGFNILGNNVTDVIFFTPDMTQFSIGFSCTTYNGRLQLGAIVDDATFSSQDAQDIIEGLIDAFELLNRATLDTCVSKE